MIAWIIRDSIAEAFSQALDAGWWFFLLLPLFVCWSIPAALGWRSFLLRTPNASIPGLGRLLVVRTEALALNSTVPTIGVGGDVLRASMTRAGGGIQGSAPPVVLDRIAIAMSEVVFAALGLAMFATMNVASSRDLVLGAVIVAVLSAAVLSWRVFFTLLAKIPWLRRIRNVDRILTHLRTNKGYRRALHRSVGWHLVERTLMMAEIWLAARFIGLEVSAGAVLFAGAMTTLFSVALFFVPGQMGAFEGGLAFAFSLIGLPATAGLSVALIRRGRQLVVALIGLGLLFGERRLDGA